MRKLRVIRNVLHSISSEEAKYTGYLVFSNKASAKQRAEMSGVRQAVKEKLQEAHLLPQQGRTHLTYALSGVLTCTAAQIACGDTWCPQLHNVAAWWI